jgi:hypothetical protein
MSKTIKTIALVAVAVAVVYFAPQLSYAIGSMALGTTGTFLSAATLATITSAITAVGISVGLAAAGSLFRKTPSMSQSMVDRLNSSVVPSATRKICFGITAAGNDVRFLEGELDLPGTKKDGYAQVIALASHRINAVKEWYVEDELSWNGAVTGAHAKGILSFRPVLEGKAGNGFAVGSGTYWNSTATFTGCAYAAVLWKLDGEVWPSGIPQKTVTVIEGCPLYDPRRDSTNGGSGAHRIDNQDTWTFREGFTEIGRNPALALLAYLIGWRVGGKLMWGMGVPVSRINLDNFRAYANLCEEGVLTRGGGSVQRYTIDGILSTADAHEAVINQITAAMGSCKLADVGGAYSLIGGYDDTLGPRQAFFADDLVAPAGSSSPYVWVPSPSIRDTYNIARGRFANPASLYQLEDWGVVETDTLPDSVPRTMSLDLGLVSRAETCQRIAKQFLLREAITPGTFTAAFGPKAFAVAVGSLVTLSLPAQGWNAKLFRVIEQVETHDLLFQMTLREEDPLVYAWDREEKPLPQTIRPQSYDPRSMLSPVDLACSSHVLQGADSQSVSEVVVTWEPEMSGRVQGIQIESRPVTTSAWTEQAALYNAQAGEFVFMANAGGIVIDVRARYRMNNGIFGPWVLANILTAPVETIDGGARDIATDARDKAEDAKGDATKIRTQLPDLVLPLLLTPIDELAALHLEGSTANLKASKALSDKNQLAITTLETKVNENGAIIAEQVTQLTSRVQAGEDTVEAGFLEINRTLADTEQALTEKITLGIANFGEDVNASFVEERRARATADEALVESIDQMGVSVRNEFNDAITGQINDVKRIVADADGAIGTRIDQMGVKIESDVDGERLAREAAIQTVEQTIVNKDSAMASRVDNIGISVNDAFAQISRVDSAWQGENYLRSLETLNLTSRLNNQNGASIEQQFQTLANWNGLLSSTYTLKLQTEVDGTKIIGGFGIVNQNGVVDTAFATDAFRIYTPGGARQVFYADGNGVQIDRAFIGKIEADDLSVTNASIQNLAISGDKFEPSAVTSVGSFEYDYGGWHEVDTSGLRFVGGSGNPAGTTIRTGNSATKVIINCTGIWERDGGDDDNLNISVQRYGGNSGESYFLSTKNNVQVFSGKRTFSFAWVDQNVDNNTDYTYRFMQQSLRDGAPYYYNVTFFVTAHKK